MFPTHSRPGASPWPFHPLACLRVVSLCLCTEITEQIYIANSGCGGGGGELSPASVYVSLLPVVEACVVVAVPGACW